MMRFLEKKIVAITGEVQDKAPIKQRVPHISSRYKEGDGEGSRVVMWKQCGELRNEFHHPA